MTPDDLHNASMAELYRLEAVEQTRALNSGLLGLERDPRHPGHLEACMRAAHSLKGAARVVGIELGVRVAHVMEDLLVAAIDGRVALRPDHFDALLQGSDLLLRVGGEPAEQLADDVDGLVQWLEALLAEPPPAVETPPPAPAALPPAAPAPSPADESVSDGRDRVLRVTAERLDLLLDLSGKTLVQFQSVQPLHAALTRLKRLQSSAGHTLDSLREALSDRATADQRAPALLAETRQTLADCRQLLAQHMAELEEFTWQGEQRAQRLYDTALASRMRPLADILAGPERMVRDLARTLGKQVDFSVDGAGTQVDRDVLDQLEAPLAHLLHNALDHGIETPQERTDAGKPAAARLSLRARHHAGMLLLELADDGRGIDLERLRGAVVARGYAAAATAARMSEQELLAFLFLPGFSLSDQVTEISGRGVGLDAVQHKVRQLRGNVHLSQRQGQGCCFRLEMPLTLSVVRSLVVEIGDEAYAFPLASIEHMLQVAPAEVVQLEGRPHLWYQQRHIGLIAASQILQRAGAAAARKTIPVVLIRDGDATYGIAVDRFVGERNLVVMPLDPRLGKIKDIAAGALLDNGAPVLILDVDDLCLSVRKLLDSGRVARIDRRDAAGRQADARHILVVDDSLTVRELQRKLLASHGYRVSVAVDGMDGWNALRAEPFDLLITDIDMPRMDGIELVTLLRRDPHLQSLPVMVVSYKDREEDRQRGLDAGADYYLAKASFHDEALLDAVHTLIGAARP